MTAGSGAAFTVTIDTDQLSYAALLLKFEPFKPVLLIETNPKVMDPPVALKSGLLVKLVSVPKFDEVSDDADAVCQPLVAPWPSL